MEIFTISCSNMTEVQVTAKIPLAVKVFHFSIPPMFIFHFTLFYFSLDKGKVKTPRSTAVTVTAKFRRG